MDPIAGAVTVGARSDETSIPVVRQSVDAAGDGGNQKASPARAVASGATALTTDGLPREGEPLSSLTTKRTPGSVPAGGRSDSPRETKLTYDPLEAEPDESQPTVEPDEASLEAGCKKVPGEDDEDELADGALFNIGKMATALAEGSDDEKMVVLFEMAQLLDHCLGDTLNTLVPAICSMVHMWSGNLRGSAAEALLDVVNLPDLPHSTAKLIAKTALDSIDSSFVGTGGTQGELVNIPRDFPGDDDETLNSDEVLNLWAEILSAALRLVTWELGELEMVTRLLDFHAFHHRDVSRKLAARVLGSLATSLADGLDVERHVLPTALALCEDVAIEVRGMVSESLALIAGRVSLGTLEQVVWPKMVSLLADPDARVHAATLRTVAHVAVQHAEPYVPPPSRAATAAAAAAAAASVAQEEQLGAFSGAMRKFAAAPGSTRASADDVKPIADASTATGRRAASMTKDEQLSRTRLLKELLTPVVIRESAFSLKAASEDQRYVDDYTYLLLEIVAEVFGPLVWAVLCGDGQPKRASAKLMSGNAGKSSSDLSFTPANPLEADTVRAFRAMATCNGPIVRRHCAFNMPGVAAAVSGIHLQELAVVVESLSQDKDAETRWNLAAGLHETAFLISASRCKAAVNSLVKAAVALLQDEHALVRMNALEHFSELLPSLVQGEPGVFVARRLAPLFANLSLLSEGNWRTQQLLSRQVAASAYLMPSETLREAVLPLLYRMAEESTYLVRMSVMGAVATCMWHIADPEQRADVMASFVTEWAEAGLHWMRLAFVEAAVVSASLFSRVLFRDVFASATLRLAADPVPNVRLRLVRALPALCRACAQMDELHRAMEALHEDSDPDVRVAIREVAPALDACLRHSASADVDDERREDEELSRREMVLSSSSSSRLEMCGGAGKRHKLQLKKSAASLMKSVRTSLHVADEVVALRLPAGLRLPVSSIGGPSSPTAGAPSLQAATMAASSGTPATSPRASSPTPAGANVFSPMASLTSLSSRDSAACASPRSLSSAEAGSSGSDWFEDLGEGSDPGDSGASASPIRRLSLLGRARSPSLDSRGSPVGNIGKGGANSPSAGSGASRSGSPGSLQAATKRTSPPGAGSPAGAVGRGSPKHRAHPGSLHLATIAGSVDLGSPISSHRMSPPSLASDASSPATPVSSPSAFGAKMNMLGHRPTLKDLKDLKARVKKLTKK
ncbi:hypothetical protein MMPV_003667 [Pyropia vietnamensis]